MKILSIMPYTFLPSRIGGQKAAEQLYDSLGRKVPVSVISTVDNAASASNSFSLIKLFSNSRSRYINVFYLHKISDIIKKGNFTHLFSEHPYLGWMCVYLKKKHGIPYIIHSQNIESIRFKSIGKKWWKALWYYERYIYQSADFVFFITEDDRKYALQNYGLTAVKALTAFYGTEFKESPSFEDRRIAKQMVCNSLDINIDTNLLLFNGSFDYAPNQTALHALIKEVVPIINKKSFSYKLIICGRNIPQIYKNEAPENVIFLDYVKDILLYNLAVDVFVNPVVEGGGIKTKLVEALAAGANSVSTKSGATGVEPDWCNGKLYVVEDGNWQLFADMIVVAATNQLPASEIFYQHFFVDSIAKKVIDSISQNLL